MTVHISRYLPSLTVGCCSNKVYALLFNENHEAMKKITSSPLLWQMASYASANHSDFCIVLGEHPQRSKYYYWEAEDDEFDLAETPDGEFYWMEIWERTASDTNYSRTEDTMHEAFSVSWDGSKFLESKIGQSQIDSMASWVAHCAVTYYPENQELRIAAWLEAGGILHSGSQQVTIKLYDRNGDELLDETQTTQVVPGFFMWDSPGLDLDPDDVYALKVTIKSSDGTDYVTGQTVITWN